MQMLIHENEKTRNNLQKQLMGWKKNGLKFGRFPRRISDG